MSVADLAYSPRLYRRAQYGLLILALLGLTSYAAVRDLAEQCRTEDQCIADSGGCLGDAGGVLADGKTTRCELTAGGWLRLELSEQAADILRRVAGFLHVVGRA